MITKADIGKPIKVSLGVFMTESADSLTDIEQEGVLTDYDEKSEYCAWEIDDIKQPIVHSNCENSVTNLQYNVKYN